MFGIGSERVIGAREVISWRAKLEGYGTNQYRHLRRESGRVPWVLRYGSVLSDCDVVKLDKNNTNKSHSKSTTFEHCTAASTLRVKKRRCISLIHCEAKLPVDSNQVTARVFFACRSRLFASSWLSHLNHGQLALAASFALSSCKVLGGHKQRDTKLKKKKEEDKIQQPKSSHFHNSMSRRILQSCLEHKCS